MNLKTTLAGALVLLAPAATALAQEPGDGAPCVTPQRSTTQLRLVPPPGGWVYVYDGHRLLGRFDRPGAMTVWTGRSYRIVAMKGDDLIWSGNVGATGAPLDLSWSPEQRTREATPPRFAAPPRGYEEGQQRSDEGQAPEPGAVPVIPDTALRMLLRTMDEQVEDADRLEAVSEASSRYAFTVPQVDWLLMRFQTDRYRLAALAQVRSRLVDPENGAVLTRRFTHPAARAQARQMLGW